MHNFPSPTSSQVLPSDGIICDGNTRAFLTFNVIVVQGFKFNYVPLLIGFVTRKLQYFILKELVEVFPFGSYPLGDSSFIPHRP